MLAAQRPAELSSQQQASKAFTAIIGDRSEGRRIQSGRKSAEVGASARTAGDMPGAVWRAAGLFVHESLRLITDLETTLNGVLARGYPLARQLPAALGGDTRVASITTSGVACIHFQLHRSDAERIQTTVAALAASGYNSRLKLREEKVPE